MNPDNPFFRAYIAATNCWLAGAGKPPLKTATTQEPVAKRQDESPSVSNPAPVAAPIDPLPDRDDFEPDTQRNIDDPHQQDIDTNAFADRDDFEPDRDPDYARQDWEARHNISNHDITTDQKLDDPRRGQGDK